MKLRLYLMAFVLCSLTFAAAQPLAAQTSPSSSDKPKESSSTTESKPASSPPAYQAILKDTPPKSGGTW